MRRSFPTASSGLIPNDPEGRTFKELNGWLRSQGTTLYQQCCLLLGDPQQRAETELLELARSGADRPTTLTALGRQLALWTSSVRLTRCKPSFNRTIRKIRPDWFVSSKVKAMQTLIQMAQDGMECPRNYKASANQPNSILAVRLRSYTNPKNRLYTPEFDKEIRKLRPDWFENRTLQKKTALFELAAKENSPKPNLPKRGKASKLALALQAYTTKTSTGYDPVFDRQIRSMRPDWFNRWGLMLQKAQQKREMLLRLAVRGAPRPGRATPLGQFLRASGRKNSGRETSNFATKIRRLAPQWFRVGN